MVNSSRSFGICAEGTHPGPARRRALAPTIHPRLQASLGGDDGQLIPFFRDLCRGHTSRPARRRALAPTTHPRLQASLGGKRGWWSTHPVLSGFVPGAHIPACSPQGPCTNDTSPPSSKLGRGCIVGAERTGFEPVSRFRRLHAFQACLFNHSSIFPLKGKTKVRKYFHSASFPVQFTR